MKLSELWSLQRGKLQSMIMQGQKKLLLKAQQLYPALDKVSHMLAVVEVHSIAQATARGTENDWYQLLQVDTTADDSVIKRNYRRLALMLHPDKNKSPGAEAAFKLIGEAWTVLSDKTKRTSYDFKRGLAAKSFGVTRAPPPKQWENGRPSVHATQPPNIDANCSQNSNVGTFWTACPHCKMQYEYYKTYLNFTLRCHKCLNSFVAKDVYNCSANGKFTFYGWQNLNAAMNIKQSGSFSFHSSSDAARSAVASAAAGIGIRNNVQSTSGVQNAPDIFKERRRDVSAARDKENGAATGTKTMNGVQSSSGGGENAHQVFEKVERDTTAGRRTPKKVKEEHVEPKGNSKKQQAMDDLVMKRKRKDNEAANRQKLEESLVRKRLKKTTPQNEDENEPEEECEEQLKKPNTLQPDSPDRFCDTASDYGIRRSSRKRNSVDYKVDWLDEDDDDDDDFISFPRRRKGGKTDVGAKPELPKHDSEPSEVHQSCKKQADGVNDGHGDTISHDNLDSDDVPGNDCEPDSDDDPDTGDQHEFVVPDSDFYDFDQERSEKSFSEGQTWAVYDDDGMPRYYCRIMKVIGGNSFGVVIKWLEALPACKQAPGRLEGVPISCGEFRCDKKQQTEKNISVFSHSMKVDVVDKNLFKIYPRKGEIWAVYKTWDLQNGRSLNADQASSLKYDLVEVLSDFSEELGVQVVWLVKVEGFNTVFCRPPEGSSFTEKRFPASELSRFSHMVLSWKLSGKGLISPALNEPLDLDSASLPLGLINMSS